MLVVLLRLLESHHVVALHNRYAPRGSTEYPPRRLAVDYAMCCPLDAKSGGTWIGFNERGLFAAVTDQHTGGLERARMSRGRLLLYALGTCSDAASALDLLERELGRGGYKRGNFLLADGEAAYHVVHDEELRVCELAEGPYVVTNLTPVPGVQLEGELAEVAKRASIRGSRALELAKRVRTNDVDTALEDMVSIARDHAHGLSPLSICYHGDPEWVMTSSTIVAVGREFENSKVLYCRGNPCRGEFADYSHLVRRGSELGTKSERLRGRRVALCVTGSVATIEAVKLARELRRHGAEVRCYATKSAIEYGVSRAALEWASGSSVVLELSGRAEHLADFDAVVVYPATFNTINKVARGIADNAVTALCASTPFDKLLVAPAMNLKLYGNPLLQESLSKLRELGATIVDPKIEEGAAKVARVEEVVDYVVRAATASRLEGRRVLVLAGPTEYPIDAVRYISNRASGRIGYWLAKEAFYRGCRVTAICGPGRVEFPRYVRVVEASTTEDMLRETLAELESEDYDMAIFSAAILDYKPSRRLEEKVRSGRKWVVELVPTPKVVDEVRRRHPDLFIVAFKLEYKASKEELVERARELMERVRAEIVVANDASRIRGEYHEALILDDRGRVEEFKGTKRELAARIFDAIEEVF